MRIVIAADKFKGSCTSLAAGEAIARGLRSVWPDAELLVVPVADGGEGFAEVVRTAWGGEWITLPVSDPLGRSIDARYLWLAQQRLAVVEVSAASGLWRVEESAREPVRSTSFGTGELMRDATQRGARKILVGLGGSATTDGGVGLAAALGYQFRRSDGGPYDVQSGDLLQVAKIEAEGAIELPEITAAADVQNPLLGIEGAAHVFAPQKGASAAEVEVLDQALRQLAEMVQRDLACDFRDTPGAGAAGGIGFGLLGFCSAELRNGFDLVAEILGLEEIVRTADLVITGEGRIDRQTLAGKAPGGVGRLARRCGKPVVAFAGSIERGVDFRAVFDSTFQMRNDSLSLAQALQRGEELLEIAARRVASELRHLCSPPAANLQPLDLAQLFPRPERPLEVDLGCGDGSFLAELAAREPERNFLGIERLAGRVRSTGGHIGRRQLTNAQIIRADIADAVARLLPPASVDVFYLLFPDPWPKRRHHCRRVFTSELLAPIGRALKRGGLLRIATDQQDYFEQMLRIVAATQSFETFVSVDDPPLPRSTFETRYLAGGEQIHRLALRNVSEPR